MADNLLDKASILLTPTAYNDGSMLSIKPENGDGDFTFSRGSAATRVNAQGLVENVQIISSELVLNGDFATDSDWTLASGISYNSNGYIDFDGTQGSGQAINTPNITFVAGKTYKVVYEIKNYVSGTIRFRFQNGVNTIGQIQSGDGVKTEYIVCNDSANNNFQFFNSASFIGSIDNVSVKEITDDTDLPRIDYTDGCGSWLLEGQSTNLYLNSETLLTQSNATSASTYTVSFYGTGTITFSGTHTGTLVGTGANDRVSATFTATSGTLTSTISGTCEKGQLENLSYATSYIPTNGSIATRLADVATNSGNASLINSTEGVLYAEIAALENGSSIKIIELNDGTSSNRVFVYLRNDRITYEVKSNGITSAGGTYDNLGVLNFHKIAVKWKDNDFALWLDGAKVLSDTSGSSPLALDRINFTDPFGGIPFYGKCKALAVYKEALTDAELQSLTTI